MKKGSYAIFMIGLLMCGFVEVTGATLIVDCGIVIDNRGTVAQNDDIHWLQDINFLTSMTYAQQITTISNLHINGYTDLHMATYSEVQALYPVYQISEIAEAFTPIIDIFPHWTGRYDRVYPSSSPLHPMHYDMGFAYDLVNDAWSGGIHSSVHDLAALPQRGAWVVGSLASTSAPVPIPSTVILLGPTLLGLLVFGRRHKKR